VTEISREDSGPSGERLELRLTIVSGTRETDCIVDAAAADSVAALAEAAAVTLDESNAAGLWCTRRGQALEGNVAVANAGIRWGDRLLLAGYVAEPTRVGGAPVAELVVSGGPCAGQRWELGVGGYTLGRDSDCRVRLSDSSLSRHHLDIEVTQDAIRVSDAGSSNGTAIDGRALAPGSWQRLRQHDELELGRSLVRLRYLDAAPEPGVVQRGGRLEFNRPPRVNPEVEPFKRDLGAPPSRGRKTRLPLAASLLPVGAGVLLFVLLKSPVMLAIAGLSPLMAISSFVSDRRGGKKSYARGSAEFRAALKTAAGELDGALEAEAAQRRRESPDASSLIARTRELAPSLWERRPGDSDFLCLRIGVADLPASSTVQIGDGGEQELRVAAEQELSTRRTVASVPVRVDVRELGVVGFAGARASTVGLARWLILQAAVLHSPGDLVIAAALGPDSAEDWSWLKWLPHLRLDRVGIEAPAVAVGRVAAEQLLSEVRELVVSRGAQSRAARASAATQPHVLLLLDEDSGVDRALVSGALSDASSANVAALWLGRDARDLPGQVRAIIEAKATPATLKLTLVDSGLVTDDASVEGLAPAVADETARLLAPIRDISELARASHLPRRVGLLDLLDLSPPGADALERRWTEWKGDLRSTLGVGTQGAFSIDLRNDGPHALIAGTTGSGKSELLRTLVAAAAANAPPNRLSFLLIDYKGGAAFAPCASLPHVVDVVSDLDEHLAERALVSLDAELKRRERILAESGARDLLELQRRNPDIAPPVLVIAVDEFAKLRDEVPAFVDGVVDIAQRGRSLGVHMVLAAQTLRNAFTPAIRANTNLRIALRVSEESESDDMIASPAAARIPSGEHYRGRAFARTGHGELREFQAAYVSGRSEPAQQRRLEIRAFDLGGAQPAPRERSGAADSDTDNDLTALGAAAREAQEHMGLVMPPPPWLPMLPTLLNLDTLAADASQHGRVAVGLIDLPHLQRQDPLIIDLATAGHVVVFGAAGSGKTTLLTTTALALARNATADALAIYGLDAGSGRLAALEKLPHCGGVVRADDEERVERLFRLLLRQIERRGVRDSTADGESTAAPLTTVLILDDLGSFAHEYDRPGFGSPYEMLARVLSSGRAAGVHVILSASRRGALPSALAAHVGQRLVLRMPTDDDLISLGLDAKTVRGARLPAGRGFTQESMEFQVAVPAHGDEIVPLSEAASSIPWQSATTLARIDVLPTEVRRDALERASGADRVPLGVSNEHLGIATVDLTDMHYLVVGPYRSGRSTALATLAAGLRDADSSAQLHLLAPRRSPLRELDVWTQQATTVEACTEAVASLLRSVESGELDGRSVYVFVDDGGELNEASVVSSLERIVRVARDGSLRVIAAVETTAARGFGLGWVRELRKEGHGLLLQPDLSSDGDILSAGLPRRLATPLSPGRGFAISRGTAELVQVAR
jgi:S-DNA-T family DNA segregation ATPase FtsK/SpoIIIE